MKQPKGITDVTALKLLRESLNPDRPATAADWDRVAELMGDRVKRPPLNAFTAQQYAERFAVTVEMARGALKAKVKDGKLDTGSFAAHGVNIKKRYWWVK